jgi:hypothetical protein
MRLLERESDFCKGLTGVGRILEDPDWYVWGCSPIYGDDGRVHVFYSRWPKEAGHGGWLWCCEVAHAVADSPEGDFQTLETVLKGRGFGWWDGMTIHNPTIHKVGDRYALFHMGTSKNSVYTKRIGLAVADSLDGPWQRIDQPLLEPDPDPAAWNSICTTNPAFVQDADGKFCLYYKSWCINDWEKDLAGGLRPATEDVGKFTNRQYGMAVADQLEGPYKMVGDGPIFNFRHLGENAQTEDATIWREGNRFKLIMRDMGIWNHEYGLYLESDDGVHWGDPQVAYRGSQNYIPEAFHGAEREGRLERPQLLIRNGKPEYLFCALGGGAYGLSSGAVLRIGDVG